MKELINKVSDTLADNFAERIADTKATIVEGFDAGLEKLSTLSESAKIKAADQVSQLIAIIPIIEELGYKAQALNVNIGITPSANFKFSRTKDIHQKDVDALLEKHQDKALLQVVTKAMVTADQCQSMIKMGKFRFDSIEVHMGLNPSVSVHLSPRH